MVNAAHDLVGYVNNFGMLAIYLYWLCTSCLSTHKEHYDFFLVKHLYFFPVSYAAVDGKHKQPLMFDIVGLWTNSTVDEHGFVGESVQKKIYNMVRFDPSPSLKEKLKNSAMLLAIAK